MSKGKMIFQWVLVAICAFSAFAWAPSFASVLFLLAAVIVLPIRKFEEVLEKIKLKFSIRIVIAVVIYVIGAVVAMNGENQKRQMENISSSSENKGTKDDKKDNGSDSKKDDKKDSGSDSKKDNNKDSRNDSGDDDAMKQIAGTWHYGASAPIDMYYTFHEDGTWEMESDNDDANNGTFKIVDGKTVEMKGRTEDRTFKIKNSDELTDEDDRSLVRYNPEEDE